MHLHSDPRSRPKLHAFYPPGNNPACHALLRLLLPLSLRLQLKITGIGISPADLARLRALRGQRCLLLPSHCGGFEPHIVLHLSRLLGHRFNYLAAMETFERSPFNAWFMQGIGAYSIIRGTADRPSFLMSKQLLVEARQWLVIFPEGHSVWQNDTVIPFQQGVVQLAFKAHEEAAAHDPEASLFCVPLAIKYVYRGSVQHAIAAALTQLEAAVFASPPPPAPDYDRLRRIGEAILQANEQKHGVRPRAEDTFDDRIQRMKGVAIQRIEEQLGISPRPDQNLLERIRALFNSVDQIVQAEPPAAPYQRRLLAERRSAARLLYDDLWRMLQFVAIYDGYVRETFTVERFMDTLSILETEVFGRRRFRGPRHALVAVGEPINLKDRLAGYRANKRAEACAVTLALESDVRTMLASLAAKAGSRLGGSPGEPACALSDKELRPGR